MNEQWRSWYKAEHPSGASPRWDDRALGARSSLARMVYGLGNR